MRAGHEREARSRSSEEDVDDRLAQQLFHDRGAGVALEESPRLRIGERWTNESFVVVRMRADVIGDLRPHTIVEGEEIAGQRMRRGHQVRAKSDQATRNPVNTQTVAFS